MAIDSYTTLQSAVAAYLGHQLFADRVPDFITMFEASANRRLFTRQQETITTITTADASADLPSDYLLWRSITQSTDPFSPLGYAPPAWVNAAFSGEGEASYFTISGLGITVYPSEDRSFLLNYYAKIPSLSDSATTNWLLTEHPDLYLFGSLCEAEFFGVNDERGPLWIARRDAIYDEVQRLSNKTRGVGAMRVMAATP